MRVLMVKMSSMGDVLHSLPAITEAVLQHPELRFDWVVEKGFEQIPTWHPAVDKVFVASTRTWRKNWRASRAERKALATALKEREYDLVIDAQGLLKSALVSRLANRPISGFSFFSARERLASLFYNKRFNVPTGHAVKRVRVLLSLSLGYALDDKANNSNNYGLSTISEGLDTEHANKTSKTLLFLHGTTWASKHWPEKHWIDLARRATEAGHAVWLPWWSDEERVRCERIAAAGEGVLLLERGDLAAMAQHIRAVDAVVAVDTGLGHMAATFSVPCLSIYGATDPNRTGTWGANQKHMRARYRCSPCLARECKLLGDSISEPPCYESCSAGDVWRVLSEMLGPTPLPDSGT
jgi:heptosyltransferase I